MAEARPLAREQASTARHGAAPLRWPQWWLALGLWLLPNVLFWWAAHYFGYQRPLVNLDYGLALLCWALGWRWVGWVLALLALALDTLAGASQIYTMFDPAQLVQALAFVPEARAEFVWVALAALGLCLACHAWAAHVLQRRQTGWRALLAALAPLALLNIGPMLAELERPQDNLHLDRRTVVLGSQTDFLHRVFYRSAIGHHLANAGECGRTG